MLKETLGIIEANPNITTDELGNLVDHWFEVEQKILKNARCVFDSAVIFDSLRTPVD